MHHYYIALYPEYRVCTLYVQIPIQNFTLISHVCVYSVHDSVERFILSFSSTEPLVSVSEGNF